ncbi:MAG: nucleotide sugar dehydrogenase, partial [Bacteroidales bacterium]|nr:nucleotide sugar dehydrogenase [Bacteroidales bacterium]
FIPGLVGGHCIGVDPYYLLHKAKELGYHARIINSGRAINDAMGAHVAEQTVKRIIAQGKEITSSRVLVMGFTFKEDVSDIRNTRVIDIVEELERYNVKYDIIDYFADKDEVKQEYGVDIVDEPNGKYDAIIVAVNHAEYKDIEEGFFANLLKDRGLIMDVKGIYRSKIKNIPYWTL